MSRTIAFSGDYPWNSQPGNSAPNRPHSEVTIWGPQNQNVRIFPIVDSGADYLQLDESILTQLGITHQPSWGTIVVCDASFCNFNFNVYRNVVVEIEGKRVVVPKIIARHGVPNLLGRSAFLCAIEVGFDGQGWLFKF